MDVVILFLFCACYLLFLFFGAFAIGITDVVCCLPKKKHFMILVATICKGIQIKIRIYRYIKKERKNERKK